jgi:hypothetical protein
VIASKNDIDSQHEGYHAAEAQQPIKHDLNRFLRRLAGVVVVRDENLQQTVE